MGLFVRNKIVLKGGHFILAEHWGLGTAPQVPHQIHGPLLLHRALRHKICVLHLIVEVIHQASAGIDGVARHNAVEIAVRPHGDTAVVQQIGIVALVNSPVGVEEFHMLVQPSAVLEGRLQGF